MSFSNSVVPEISLLLIPLLPPSAAELLVKSPGSGEDSNFLPPAISAELSTTSMGADRVTIVSLFTTFGLSSFMPSPIKYPNT